MRPLTYIPATSLAEATEALAQYGPTAAILAGGTDLLIEWRRESWGNPIVAVDISRLAALMGITLNNGTVTMGPLVTHTEVLESPLLREVAPLLSRAASTIGSVQIRNRGTIGGNIMNAAACADSVPPLVALDAEVDLKSATGSRTMKLQELFAGPYKTNATPGEILTCIRFPILPLGAHSTFVKLGRRNALSISRLSVAAVLQCDTAGFIQEARIVPGAAFPTWQRMTRVEAMLQGEKPSDQLFTAAGKAVAEDMVATTGRRWSTEYKEPVIAVLVRRALEASVPKGVNS